MWWENSRTTILTPILIILDGETVPTFHGLKYFNRMKQELHLHQCNQFIKIFKSLNHHSKNTITIRTTHKPNHRKKHSKVAAVLEQQNCTIEELRNERRMGINSQAQLIFNLKTMVGQLASSFIPWQWLLGKINFQASRCPILREYMQLVAVHGNSMKKSKPSWPCGRAKKSTTK